MADIATQLRKATNSNEVARLMPLIEERRAEVADAIAAVERQFGEAALEPKPKRDALRVKRRELEDEAEDLALLSTTAVRIHEEFQTIEAAARNEEDAKRDARDMHESAALRKKFTELALELLGIQKQDAEIRARIFQNSVQRRKTGRSDLEPIDEELLFFQRAGVQYAHPIAQGSWTTPFGQVEHFVKLRQKLAAKAKAA